MASYFIRASTTYLVLLGLMAACQKSETPPAPAAQQRVFTNGQEIKDEAVTKRFIQQSSTPFSAPTPFGPDEYVRFVGPDSVQFFPDPQRYSFTKQGNRYLFYSPFGPPTQNPHTAVRALKKYTAAPVPVPMAVGEYISRDVRVGYEEGASMQLPVFHFRLKRTSGVPPQKGVEEQAGVVFNEFNEDAIATLGPGDTLAIQVSRVTLPVK